MAIVPERQDPPCLGFAKVQQFLFGPIAGIKTVSNGMTCSRVESATEVPALTTSLYYAACGVEALYPHAVDIAAKKKTSRWLLTSVTELMRDEPRT
jgi:hypothetical protein